MMFGDYKFYVYPTIIRTTDNSTWEFTIFYCNFKSTNEPQFEKTNNVLWVSILRSAKGTSSLQSPLHVWRNRSLQTKRNFCLNTSSLLLSTSSTEENVITWLKYCWLWRRTKTQGIKTLSHVRTSVSRLTTYDITWITEPFEQPTFCFDNGEWISKIEFFDHVTLNVSVFVGASDHLPSADTWLLYIYCIMFANTLQ